MKRIFTVPASLLALITTPYVAHAGTATGSMPVSATVLENCTVAATPLVFGALSSVGEANVDSTSTITLICTPNADFEIALNDGGHASGGQRRLKHATNSEFVSYNVFIDPARSQRWGNTSGTDTKTGTAPTGTSVHTAYGRIPAGVSSVSAGSYSDVLTVTVIF